MERVKFVIEDNDLIFSRCFMNHPCLAEFHPAVARWFAETYGEPTPPQAKGWPLIGAGKNVLILAPTGSGKTMAAFLKCLDWLYRSESAAAKTGDGVRVLYISPLKALNNDIHRNLELPLAGIAATGRALGYALPELRAAVRTGDTPGRERQQMIRKPPQILITTPESLFLMLSSKARQILKTVRFVIVDEIHTVFPTKRGAHLGLTLERLQQWVGAERPLQRIGLSATMQPLDQVAAYLAGYEWSAESDNLQPRPVAIVDTGQRKTLDLQIMLPVPDLRELPEKSIWPPLYDQLLQLIRAHRTTLIFVNNRRAAERITANLNQLAEREIARTHHGSVSKEVRLDVEALLKQGEIACIVATASLELGIDVGHIDLVVQVESPKEVARGLQRVGRAGHIVGMPSKGRVIPKTRTDLLESAAIVREMRAGRVEPARAIRNCLDVLAQQLVAMTAVEEVPAATAYRLIRRAYNYQDLTVASFENVLAMLAGTFQTTEYVDLRPRLYWDRVAGLLKPDSYGWRLVYSSGGTIPDRGYYGVYLQGSNVRLGELDEEFVYERRLHERFVLGTSVWRIEELRQDRVLVSQSKKGGEAIIPFWKADLGGRSYELGKRIGAFLGEVEARLDSPGLRQWLATECALEADAARNLVQFLRDQQRAVNFLPTDRRIVVEEFPDEAGEWRIFIHSPFGTKLHNVLGLLIKDDWENRLQLTTEFVSSDNGIMFQVAGLTTPPAVEWERLPMEDLEEKVARLVSGSALFGVNFRQAAQLSLVMPRTGFGRKRTPFWLSRLKAGNLLQVVAKYPDFPLVVEAYRAVLQDYFELPAVRELLGAIRQGTVTIQRQRLQVPSPFAAGHLLSFVANFMYQGETPQGELKLRLFGLGRETLKSLVGATGLRELLDPALVAAVAAQAGGKGLYGPELTTDMIVNWLERVGDITLAELQTLVPEQYPAVAEGLNQLLDQGKVIKLPLRGRELWLLRSEWPFYRQVVPELTVSLPNGEHPVDLLGPKAAQRRLIQRYVRTHGPFQAQAIVERYGLAETTVLAELAALSAQGLVEAGAFIPGGCGEEWCDSGLLQEMHRRSLARARREVEPGTPEQYSLFLARWQGVVGERTGLDGLAETLQQFSGLWLPAVRWEGSVLPGRVRNYQPFLLDQLITSGQFRWRAKGTEGNLRLCFEAVQTAGTENPQETAATATPAPPDQLTPNAQKVYQCLAQSGALSLPQLWQQAKLASVTALEVLEELVRAGLVTNDTFGPVRHLLAKRPQDRVGVKGILPPVLLARLGRWSLVPPLRESSLEDQLRQLLARYGILCRELLTGEEHHWSSVYPQLNLWEQTGKVKRGYFVAGLSGIQYAETGAVERLRQPFSEADPPIWALHWDDPANPLPRFADWSEPDGTKLAGDYVVFKGGRPVLLAAGKKLKLTTLTELVPAELRTGLEQLVRLWCQANPDRKITVSHYNGAAVQDSAIVRWLAELGFENGYLEMTLWPSRR